LKICQNFSRNFFTSLSGGDGVSIIVLDRFFRWPTVDGIITGHISLASSKLSKIDASVVELSCGKTI